VSAAAFFADALDCMLLDRARLAALVIWELDLQSEEQSFNAADQIWDTCGLEWTPVNLKPPPADFSLEGGSDSALKTAFLLFAHDP
jgi:hypothetical protein